MLSIGTWPPKKKFLNKSIFIDIGDRILENSSKVRRNLLLPPPLSLPLAGGIIVQNIATEISVIFSLEYSLYYVWRSWWKKLAFQTYFRYFYKKRLERSDSKKNLHGMVLSNETWAEAKWRHHNPWVRLWCDTQPNNRVAIWKGVEKVERSGVRTKGERSEGKEPANWECQKIWKWI